MDNHLATVDSATEDAGEPVGIIGVGHLAQFFVQGLRRVDRQRLIYLSPRNAELSARLVREHGCVGCASNDEVVERASVIVVATPVAACLSAIAGLPWRSDHLLLSVVASIGLEGLAHAAPQARIVRALPAPSSAWGLDTIPITPDEPRARSLLGALGTVVPIDDEQVFTAVGAAGLFQLWTYGLLDALATAVEAAGCDRKTAVDIVAGHIGSAAAYARATNGRQAVRASLNEEARPGTLTRAGLDVLDHQGAFQAWADAYATVLPMARGH